MENLNVIIVCDYANTNGGAEKVAIESAIGLAKKGLNVIFFSAVGPIDDKLLEYNNIKVVCLNQSDLKGNSNKLIGFLQGIWNINAKKEFNRLLNIYSKENTIIHAHLWQKALSPSIFYTAIRKKYKIIFTMHHYFLSCPNGGFYDYKKNEICNCQALHPKCLIKNCDSRNYFYKLFRILRFFIEKYIVRLQFNIKHFICISKLGYEVSKKSFCKDSKFYYVNNPFNIEKQCKVDVVKNKYYIFVGRLSAEKGVVKLAEMSKDLNIPVMIIGDGPEKQKMKDINPNLIFKGWLSQDQVAECVKKSRALIFPTLWYEGMPMSILECFAQGVPAIIPNTCAATQIVKNNETGFVYQQNNINSFKGCIQAVENDVILNRVSKKAYDYFWSSNYSTENHCNSLIEIYCEILKEFK